jgi:SAM-dependent methyltransferase
MSTEPRPTSILRATGLDENLERIAQRLGYRNFSRWRQHANFVFAGTKLADARVLDVGCGQGVFVIWAALSPAAYALGIEPEADGSDLHQHRELLPTIADELQLWNLEWRKLFLHQLSIDRNGAFDTVLLHNVINHLKEDAVPSLQYHDDAYRSYVQRLGILHDLVAPGGKVIVADAGRRNWWNRIGMRSPFAPSIEWQKHQQPEVWASLFGAAGFALEELRWSPVLGRLPSNGSLQYFTDSHFVLRFRRPSTV